MRPGKAGLRGRMPGRAIFVREYSCYRELCDLNHSADVGVDDRRGCPPVGGVFQH